MVNCIQIIIHTDLLYQVLLVTGGFITDGDDFTILSSTETLVEGSSAWANAGELPVALQLLRGVSLNNNIFMTGNI